MTEDEAAERLRAQCGLGEAEAATLVAYLKELEKWNRTQNLTAVRGFADMVDRHVVDSLALVGAIGQADASVADIGSGAGLPGIPLAVARPNWSVTLVESREKKATFLRHVVASADLGNVEVVCGRAEEWRPEKKPDVLVARAVASLAKLAKMARHLARPGLRLLALKGSDPHNEGEELEASCPEWRIDSIEKISAPQSRWLASASVAP